MVTARVSQILLSIWTSCREAPHVGAWKRPSYVAWLSVVATATALPAIHLPSAYIVRLIRAHIASTHAFDAGAPPSPPNAIACPLSGGRMPPRSTEIGFTAAARRIDKPRARKLIWLANFRSPRP